MTESYAERVLRISTERNEFLTGDDGYVVWWPDGSTHGALVAAELRILAAELDRRNAAWDKQVQEELERLSVVLDR